MYPRVGVGVFVFNGDHQILIGLRKGSHGAGTSFLLSILFLTLTFWPPMLYPIVPDPQKAPTPYQAAILNSTNHLLPVLHAKSLRRLASL